MKRTLFLGLTFVGVIALANGCNSTPPPRDYHEYSSIRAGQPGAGDSVGMGMYNNYGKAANGRPMGSRQSDMASSGQE